MDIFIRIMANFPDWLLSVLDCRREQRVVEVFLTEKKNHQQNVTSNLSEIL